MPYEWNADAQRRVDLSVTSGPAADEVADCTMPLLPALNNSTLPSTAYTGSGSLPQQQIQQQHHHHQIQHPQQQQQQKNVIPNNQRTQIMSVDIPVTPIHTNTTSGGNINATNNNVPASAAAATTTTNNYYNPRGRPPLAHNAYNQTNNSSLSGSSSTKQQHYQQQQQQRGNTTSNTNNSIITNNNNTQYAESERLKSQARYQILKEISQATNMRNSATNENDVTFWEGQIHTLNESFKKL